MTRVYVNNVFILLLITSTLIFVDINRMVVVTHFKISHATAMDVGGASHQADCNTQIVILYWKSVRRGIHGGFGGNFDFSDCPFQCVMTTNKSMLNQSDVVVMNYQMNKDIPQHRKPHQKWVFYAYESPLNTLFPEERRMMFNESFTYKRSSNIPNIQYEFRERDKERDPFDMSSVSVRNPYGHRKKVAAMVVSHHCTAYSKRGEVIGLLQQHVNVDVYGDCGHLKCNSSRGQSQINTFAANACFQFIRENYLFYLAFENALCEDYVTEKLFRAIDLGMVPVVYGGLSSTDYSDVLPAHSYINIEDYNSPTQIAQTLQFLSDNPSEYMRYFEWKKNYVFQYKTMEIEICNMCGYFHRTRNDPPKVIDGGAFFASDTNCREPMLWQKYLNVT